MRIDNSKTFDKYPRYRIYRQNPKEPVKDEYTGTEQIPQIYQSDSALPIFSIANQATVDNPDGSRDMYLTANIDGTKPLFAKIKLY